MAKKVTPDPAAGASKKSKKKLFLIGGGALILVAGGVGGGVYASTILAPHGKAEDPMRPKLVEREANGSSSSSSEDEKEAPPKIGTVSVTSDKVAVDPRRFEVTYVPLEQAFTANLANGGIIQVGLSFSTYYDHRVVENVKRQTVPIRSAALMVLSAQDPEQLSTPAGKAHLQHQLTDAVNSVLRSKEGFGGIDNVYFTSLVIQ